MSELCLLLLLLLLVSDEKNSNLSENYLLFQLLNIY